jgi:hypothetical protein
MSKRGWSGAVVFDDHSPITGAVVFDDRLHIQIGRLAWAVAFWRSDRWLDASTEAARPLVACRGRAAARDPAEPSRHLHSRAAQRLLSQTVLR